MSAAARTLPTPKEPLDVAAREQVPVELLELADGVGDGEEPPGLRGHGAGPQRQPESGPPGGGVDGFARATSPRDVDPPAAAPVVPPGWLCVRLDVGAGDGSGPAGGLRLEAVGGRDRGGLDGHVAGSAARVPEGRGELVDVDRQTSGPPGVAAAATARSLDPEGAGNATLHDHRHVPRCSPPVRLRD